MEKREITLGHSPDPDDAFMFYALAAEKIETGGLSFTHVIQDIVDGNPRPGDFRLAAPIDNCGVHDFINYSQWARPL